MKCPNCGTHNGKTNKYCRDCGTRLEVIVPKEAKQEPESRSDEVRLGEELFAVHELLEADDLEAALEKGAKLATDNPGSASAHAIVAMVCERLAEGFSEQGETERAREYLRLAIARYETVIDLNPDSAADREKLASMRLKYTGQAPPTPPEVKTHRFAAAVNAIPKPMLAAGAAFVVLISLVVLLTASPKAKPIENQAQAPSTQQQPMPPVPQSPTTEPAMSVYTFPQANNSAQPPRPSEPMHQPPPRLPEAQPSVELKPVKVPAIDHELTLAPETNPAQQKKSEPEPKPAEAKPVQPANTSSGDTYLAEAIQLANQGMHSEAISAANRAVAAFNRSIEANVNVDASKRGIANANRLISHWRQSL